MSLRAHPPAPGRRGALGISLRCAAVWLGVSLLAPRPARAGRQVEEPLADAVRTALSAAIHRAAPPRLTFDSPQAHSAHQRWRARVGPRLQRRMPEAALREAFLDTLWYESARAGLEPALVLGLIEVESGFRKYAISSAGARGLMQVMPFWVRLIGDGDAARLFHLQTNLRFGCVILRHYLDTERGNLFLALGRYNGSRGQAAYPNAVLAARKRWDLPADAPAG